MTIRTVMMKGQGAEIVDIRLILTPTTQEESIRSPVNLNRADRKKRKKREEGKNS